MRKFILHKIRTFLKQNPRFKFPVFWLLGIFFIGIFLEFISSDKPIIAKVDDLWYMPSIGYTLSEIGVNNRYNKIRRVKWDKHDSFKIMPIIPYSAKSLDLRNSAYKSPFDQQEVSSLRYRHWLGTDKIGRDILAGLLNGCRVVTKIIFLVGFISGMLGLFLGGFAGFYGDKSIRWSLLKIIFYLISTFLLLYTSFMILKVEDLRNDSVGLARGIFALLLPILGLLMFNKIYEYTWGKLEKRISLPSFYLPVDSIFYSIVVLLTALPVSVLLIAVLGYFKSPSLSLTMTFFGLILWKGIARIIRAEVLRIKQQDYILAARQLGLSNKAVFWKHIFPNIKNQFFVTIAMVLSASLLIESTLSFLGIGMAVGEISWGVLLSQGKFNISAYWLSLFPGILLVLTIYSLNVLAEAIRKVN
jgi:peptide/nickel transport system permease protein